MARYTVPAMQVDADLTAHMNRWHGQAGQAARSAQKLAQALTEGRDAPDVYDEFSRLANGSGTVGQDSMSQRIPEE